MRSGRRGAELTQRGWGELDPVTRRRNRGRTRSTILATIASPKFGDAIVGGDNR